MDNPNYRILTATKSIDLPQWPVESWTWYNGKPVNAKDVSLVQNVAWMFRASKMIAQCLADIPFALQKGDSDFDTSDDWQNKVGFWPNPKRTFKQISMALNNHGCAYLLRERSTTAIKRLRFLDPTSVTPHIDPINGLDYFERSVNGTMKRFKPIDDIIYFWPADDRTEEGPPTSYPAKAASAAGGVLHNVDEFSAGFFANGAIKATIMAVAPGTPPGEQERMEKSLKKVLTGVRNAFRFAVFGIGSDSKPMVIGEGLEALKDAGAITRAREDVSAGYGTSVAMILSSEANYATALQDRKNLYQNVAIPDANDIAETMNEQLWKPLGYKLVFKPESLEVFQEDENERAQAWATYVNAGMPPEIAAEMLGLDMPDGLEYADLKKEEPPPQLQQPPQPQPEQVQAQEQPPAQPNEAQAKEQAQYQRKSLNAIKAGKSPDVEFICEHITAEQQAVIRGKLAQCKTAEDVKAVFSNIQPLNIDPPADPIMALASELKRANDLLEATAHA